TVPGGARGCLACRIRGVRSVAGIGETVGHRTRRTSPGSSQPGATVERRAGSGESDSPTSAESTPEVATARNAEVRGFGQARLRDRGSGVELGQGAHGVVARTSAEKPWPPGHDAETRPVHQRRSWDDEPV